MSLTALGRRIRAARYGKGLGMEELADQARVSRTALYQIETGKVEMPLAGTLIRIARTMDLNVEDLISNLGMPKSPSNHPSMDEPGTVLH